MVASRLQLAAVIASAACAIGAAFVLTSTGGADNPRTERTDRPERASARRAPDRTGITGIVFSGPVSLDELAPLLELGGITPVEFSHERQTDEGTVSGGFAGSGMPLAEQVAEYRATYRDEGGDGGPWIVALVVEGTYSKSDIEALLPHVAETVALPGR